MHFTEAGIKPFLQIFNSNKAAIGAFEGCTHLELLQDLDDTRTYTTLSHWKDAESLERYRKSELFTSVWRKVKPLFSERTQAYSMVRV